MSNDFYMGFLGAFFLVMLIAVVARLIISKR
jgi:hypothetical protein